MSFQLIYAEKDIEDILANDCENFLGLRYINRQFKTEVGIVDLIAQSPHNKNLYYVIEIKKGILDTSAYCQVLRYTKFLNYEFSKYGKRLFLPVLIGENLAPEIHTITEYLDEDAHGHSAINYINTVYYRLFDFSPMEGVCFTYSSKQSSRHKESLMYRHNHIEDLVKDYEKRIFYLETQNEPTKSYHLNLVKDASYEG